MLERTGKERSLREQTTMLFHQSEVLTADPEKGPDAGACFVVIRGPQQGRQFFVTMDEMFIGRDIAADMSIPEQSMSRRHARVVAEGGAVRIVDNHSSNGTFVNGTRLPPGEAVTLMREDQITLGGVILKFLPAGAIEIRTFTEMERAANTDPLTHAFNKRYLLEALEAHVGRAKAQSLPCAIVFLDLDLFKHVNDAYGHLAGDDVLREFSRVIAGRFLRGSDVFARFGGEEFVVLLPSTTGADALKVAERIRAAVESHTFTCGSASLRLTTSAGVAALTDEMHSGTDLLDAADKALYASKQGGRNRVSTN